MQCRGSNPRAVGGSRGLVSHARRTRGDTALGKMTAYIIHIPLWCNGSTIGSDPIDIGSNPVGGAMWVEYIIIFLLWTCRPEYNIAALLSKSFT